jgi:hypothetical protein
VKAPEQVHHHVKKRLFRSLAQEHCAIIGPLWTSETTN